MKKMGFVVIAIFIAAFCILIYFDFLVRERNTNVASCVDCGPYFGEHIDLALDTLNVDHSLEIPNGQMVFLHMRDNLSPVLVKIGLNRKIEWSVKLTTDNPNTCDDVPMLRMLNPRVNLDRGIRIYFFNDSHSEPGHIVLSDNYDFKYMCLKMW